MTTHRTRARALLAALALALLLCGNALAAPAALAHSTLVGSDPADGSTLQQAPTRVRLTFNEDVRSEFSKVIVTAPGGRAVTTTVSGSGPEVDAVLPSGLGAGGYRVVYSVVSADTHRVSGELRFTVAGTTPTASSAAPTTSAPSGASSSAAAPTRGSAAGPSPSATRSGSSSTSYWAWLGPLAFVVLCVPLVWVASRQRARRRRRQDEEHR